MDRQQCAEALSKVLEPTLEYIAGHRLPPREYEPLMNMYGFNRTLGDHRATFGKALELVSRRTLRSRGVMLSVLVVLKETNQPSSGFFTLADELGYRKPNESDDQFVARALDEVYRKYSID